jgi:glycosyltransferase involved in cell wall biosynthesis
VIPNCLDEAAFDEPPPEWVAARRAEIGVSAEAPVVGCVASLQPIKDHATLLRAVARLRGEFPALRLVLVGADNGSLAELRALVVELGIGDQVNFAGLRPSLPTWHHLFDVSTLTSVSEGLPNSVLEAMAAGRPVVATDVGALRDAVAEGETGHLVRAGDDAALADRIAGLLRDPARARRFGERGRVLAQENYSAAAAMNGLLSLYASVAGRSHMAGA